MHHTMSFHSSLSPTFLLDAMPEPMLAAAWDPVTACVGVSRGASLPQTAYIMGCYIRCSHRVLPNAQVGAQNVS